MFVKETLHGLLNTINNVAYRKIITKTTFQEVVRTSAAPAFSKNNTLYFQSKASIFFEDGVLLTTGRRTYHLPPQKSRSKICSFHPVICADGQNLHLPPILRTIAQWKCECCTPTSHLQLLSIKSPMKVRISDGNLK